MERFAKMFERVDQTTGINEKIAAMAEYFRQEPIEEKIWAVLLLRGRIKQTPLTSRALRASFARLSQAPQWLLDECYAHVGDTGETLALLMSSGIMKLGGGTQERSLHQWLTEECPGLRQLDDQSLDDKLLQFWSSTRPEHRFLLNKILTGAFRVGVSDRLVLKALAQSSGESEAVWHQWLLGKSERDFEELKRVFLGQAPRRETLQAVPFCLAAPLDNAFFESEQPESYFAEWKWDGIRAQIIKKADKVWIWSRGEDMITESFPEIAQMAGSWPEDTILDGEMLVWGDDHPKDFHLLQRRLGRSKITSAILKEAPATFVAYDFLHLNGEDLTHLPLELRRRHLERFVGENPRDRLRLSPLISFQSWQELKNLQQTARERGAEGLMLKRKSADYTGGRKRGVWWKFKVEPYTLDAVLLYAQAGSGKRSNLFTDYTFALWRDQELVPFAKAYSGLDNKEIEELDRWIRRNTKEKFGPVRSLNLEQVFEIAFEGIAPSPRHKSGIAVRFPRILRWRKDKKPPDADRLEDAWKLIAAPV
ncbi:MAG: ATP-dependent DNA ligase [Bdellovibrionales bacterium]|nr:ATP-dependent DNA ligase [Bdellovibrionales bacterium]